MAENKLQLNDKKTEFLIICAPWERDCVQYDEIEIGDARISSTTDARNLGVIMDKSLNMEKIHSKLCQTSIAQLRNIADVRKYLTQNTNYPSEIWTHHFHPTGTPLASSGAPHDLLTTHRALNGKAPKYITDLLTPYIPARNLRSEGEANLVVPKTHTKTFGERAFSFAAAVEWNKLPKKLRENNALSQFKSYIKTCLFTAVSR